ncbi:hypothetical protein L202_00812 [Cryptococcus amylolentus CBS 6039]|uniref:Uncharacterized protein n=1 Tax=Cryptococcus amylolentus CBS 6039 TaxID=1295533 RepID=A0A1E3I8J6_9TREE|nr:hypothetical protein L202_00812 [Cryptococcus amylolentus CBS 6039]ODN84969.1 hypothetical protein L202_00812 [Cryptococcus amylolentus CBS 6039]
MPPIQTVPGTPTPPLPTPNAADVEHEHEHTDEQAVENLLPTDPDDPQEHEQEQDENPPAAPPSSPPTASTRLTISTAPTTPLSSPRFVPLPHGPAPAPEQEQEQEQVSPPSTPSTPVSFRFSHSTPQRPLPGQQQQTPRYDGLTSRRPVGWISSLGGAGPKSRGVSDNAIPSSKQRATSGISQSHGHGHGHSQGKGVKARVSGVAFGGVEGRRVSGAMKYALQSGESREPRVGGGGGGRIVSTTSAREFDLSQHQFDLAAASADSPILNEREEDEDEDEDLGEEEAESIRYQVSTAQEQDELWMAHVREQLNTLFPDFFAAEPGDLGDLAGLGEDMAGRFQEEEGDEEEEGEGDKSVGSVRVRSVDDEVEGEGEGDGEGEEDQAEETSFTTSASATTSPSLNLQTPPPTGLPRSFSSSMPLHRSQRQVTRGRGSFGVPNVREEITDLREEIMRLRSVVGGLADGMRAEYAVEVAAIEREDPGEGVRKGETEREQKQGQGEERMMQVPESYVRTANKSIEILLHLDTLVRVPDPSSPVPEQGATRTLEMRDINAVFEESNLGKILEFVKGLGGAAGGG